MRNFLFVWGVYAAAGLAAESVFTGFRILYDDWKAGRKLDRRLYCRPMLWSIFVFGLSAAIGYHPVVLGRIGVLGWAWPLRGLFYTAGIYIFEFFWGWLLERLIGFCPWDYRPSLTSIKGYIELKYAPFWFFFGFLLERISIILAVLLE